MGEKITEQTITSGDNTTLYQAGRDIILGINKCPPDIRLVHLKVDDDNTGAGLRQKLSLVLKNNGDKTAVLLHGMILVSSSERITNCNNMHARYQLIRSNWTYDVDISADEPNFEGKHAIAPNEVVSFEVIVGRKTGGYESTIYKCHIRLVFDEGVDLDTNEFFLQISGPTTIAGMYIPHGPSEDEWGTCWADNIRRLDNIGYDARPMIHPDSATHIEKVAPGLMSKK